MTIAIPMAVKRVSPHLPVLKTQPFPRAITHALSRPFGKTYIANSPRLRFSSTNKDNPVARPGTANEGLEIRRSMTHWGIRFKGEERKEVGTAPVRRKVRNWWTLCLKQNRAMTGG